MLAMPISSLLMLESNQPKPATDGHSPKSPRQARLIVGILLCGIFTGGCQNSAPRSTTLDLEAHKLLVKKQLEGRLRGKSWRILSWGTPQKFFAFVFEDDDADRSRKVVRSPSQEDARQGLAQSAKLIEATPVGFVLTVRVEYPVEGAAEPLREELGYIVESAVRGEVIDHSKKVARMIYTSKVLDQP